MAYKIFTSDLTYLSSDLNNHGSQKYKFVSAHTADTYGYIALTFEEDTKTHQYVINSFYEQQVIDGSAEAWINAQLDLGYVVKQYFVEPSGNKKLFFILEKAGQSKVQEYQIKSFSSGSTEWLNEQIALGYKLDRVCTYAQQYHYVSVTK